LAAAPASALSGENGAPTKGATVGVWSSTATVRGDGVDSASAGLAQARASAIIAAQCARKAFTEASLEGKGNATRSPAFAALSDHLYGLAAFEANPRVLGSVAVKREPV